MLQRLLRAVRHPIRTVSRRRFRRDNGYRRVADRALSLAAIGSYQPLYGRDVQDRPEIRPVLARWDVIQPFLPSTGSALDVGCNNGWFTFKMSEQGLLALGVDLSSKAIQTARLLNVQTDAERVGFVRCDIDRNTVDMLPEVDVILCLSVFHHLVRFQGVDPAFEIMQTLANKARHQFYFETGQSNEVDTSWVDAVAFMGDDPTSWVHDFVESLGFSEVTRLGDFRGCRTEHLRRLVVGTR